MIQGPSLEYYGDLLTRYKGKGCVTTHSGEALECEFEAGQLRNGEVLLLCHFFNVHPNLHIKTFQGRSDDNNWQISSTRPMLETPSDQTIKVTDKDSHRMLFRLEELTVEVLKKETNKPQDQRFGVANLIFTPLRIVNGFPRGVLLLRLETKTGTHRVVIHPCQGYKDRMDRIRKTKSIDVTSEVVVDLSNGGVIDEATQMVNNLCYILSVAYGTKINWIYRDICASDGRPLRRLHRNAITKRYVPLSVIEFSDPNRLIEFVEQVYSAYVRKKRPYHLDHGIIDAYLDAKQESDFLELRGLKMVVVMEMIVWHLSTVLGIKADILGCGEFRKLRNAVRNTIKTKILPGSEMSKKRSLVYSKISELKRRPFRDTIKRITSHSQIGLLLPEDELKLLIRCRNSLVHKGDFYCNTANSRDREKCPPRRNGTEEYFFLTSVLDRMFLKILEYRGTYVDCGRGFSNVTLQ